MVKTHTTPDAPWVHYVTDDGLWEVRTKSLTLEKFESKMCGTIYKTNKAHRWNCLERWIESHLKPIPRDRAYTRAERDNAVAELRNYLFSEENWS